MKAAPTLGQPVSARSGSESAGMARALILLILLAMVGALAAQPESSMRLRQARLDPSASVADALQQAEQFVAADPQSLQVSAAGDDGVDWLWLEASAAVPEAPVLVLDRVALRRLQAWRVSPAATEPQAIEPVQSFFQPAADALLASQFVLPWPSAQADGAAVLLRVDAVSAQRVSLRLLSEREQLRDDRTASIVAAGSYAAMLAAVLASLALTLAVRQSVFRFFTGFALVFLLFLAAADGFLFELPLLGQAGAMFELAPILSLGLASSAAALAFATRLLGLAAQSPPLSVWSDRIAWGLLALGLLGLAVPAAWDGAWLQLATFLMLIAALLPVVMAAWSWSLGSLFSALLCVLWALFLLVMGSRGLALAGWMVPSDALRGACQLGGALAVVGLSIALTERVIALRRQVEQIQQLHAESAANLQVEQHRRHFSNQLKELAGTAVASGDMEWRAFRLLMQAVGELITTRSIGVSATGYRGFDYMLSEPMSSKARLCALLADRAATLKGICRSRTAMQVAFDVSDTGRDMQRGQFAVVPFAIARPGWGALILERESGLEFSSVELSLASDLAELALNAIEDSALKADLRRSAEVDALTGLINRRAGESRLETLLQTAASDKSELCLLFVDFDNFRPINDRHGVGVGDRCLRLVADLIRPMLTPQDLLFRYGGDEFVLAQPGHGLQAALALAERIRAEVASQRIKTDQGPAKLTVSIGVAAAVPASDTVSRMIDRTERASGMAKGQGRNQVQQAPGFGAQGPAPSLPGF